MPSSRRRKSPTRSSGVAPEILHQLGRVALSYSLKKLNEPKAQPRQRDQSARQRSSHSKTRDGSSTSKRGSSSRDMPRSDSSSSDDLHGLISQLAVGAVAFGIRQVVRRRREAKRQAAAAAQATATERSVTSGPAAIDGELSAALDAVTRELQGASESIRRLAYSAPPSHRNCEVRDALAADAERLSGLLANMQASIHNMRNLHPGLDGAKPAMRGRSRRERGEAVERDGEVSMAATGEAEARVGERRSRKCRRVDSRSVRERIVQRGLDRLHQPGRSSHSRRCEEESQRRPSAFR